MTKKGQVRWDILRTGAGLYNLMKKMAEEALLWIVRLREGSLL